jgi:hypothetical protein
VNVGKRGDGGDLEKLRQAEDLASMQEIDWTSAMDYFCYISRDKVDQLYTQYYPEQSDEIKETRSAESNVTADAHLDWNIAHIFSLFKIGGTYGRKGVIQYESKIKKSYVGKLQAVLVALAKERPIPPLLTALDTNNFSSLVYHYRGLFRPTQNMTSLSSSRVVRLKGKNPGLAQPLLLDCSLRNFSEGPLPDGTFEINSSNASFFTDRTPLTMSTVFLLLHRNKSAILGSPLFLKLSTEDSDGDITRL